MSSRLLPYPLRGTGPPGLPGGRATPPHGTGRVMVPPGGRGKGKEKEDCERRRRRERGRGEGKGGGGGGEGEVARSAVRIWNISTSFVNLG